MEGGGSCSLNSRLQHIQIRPRRVHTWCPCPHCLGTLCHLGSQAHAVRPWPCLDKIGPKKPPGKSKYASAWGQPRTRAARCKVLQRGRDRSPRGCQADGCTCIPHAARSGYLAAESGCSGSSLPQSCSRRITGTATAGLGHPPALPSPCAAGSYIRGLPGPPVLPQAVAGLSRSWRRECQG